MTEEKNIVQTNSILLDRDLYRTIKKMDRLTMQGLIQDIYESGKKKGTEEYGSESSSAAEIDFDALKAEISAIKGIGEKRVEQIMEIVTKHLNQLA